MNKRLAILISIVLLSSLAIVGGSYLLRQVTKNNGQQQAGQNQNPSSTATDYDASNSANLPALPASPSATQVDKYVEEVREMAREGSVLEITGCVASPAIFKIKQGADFNIKNNDDKQITVAISPKATYKVDAKKSLAVKMTASAAIYKYNCIYNGETSYKQAGVVEVTK